MKETIRRGDAWWTFAYGFGRIQRARALSYSLLPDAVKRAQIANQDITMKELMDKVGPEVYIQYSHTIRVELAVLVLDSAHDWNKSEKSARDYVDEDLPEGVGDEIAGRIADVISGAQLSDDEKKTSELKL